jgi:hypothetical protein
MHNDSTSVSVLGQYRGVEGAPRRQVNAAARRGLLRPRSGEIRFNGEDVTKPEQRVLILDEPTEGIQPSVVAEIEQTIMDLTTRGGLSVLLVEQHVGFAPGAAAQYYVLASGRAAPGGGPVPQVLSAMMI